MWKKFLVFCSFLIPFLGNAQFTLKVFPSATLNSAPAIHSGAFTVYNGKWVFIGGRKNGLHGFLPPFAFPGNGVNNMVWVVDPATNQSWSSAVDSLPVNIKEAVASSNMEFYRTDSILYMVGGYGWKDSLQDFVTFPVLTSVHLPGLIDAVINNKKIIPFFKSTVDQRLAVCGGHLQKLDSVYYLVFGHRFDGRYDKSSTTGFFVQKYSNEIRKFTITENAGNIQIGNYSSIKDTANFHRRDFNLIPQIYASGVKALTAFSGVFQYTANLPYMTCIDITKSGYTHQSGFNQNLSQYHSAVAALYDTTAKDQHNIFFGGISQYYIDSVSGNTVYDTLVPFVNTVSKVVRSAANTYQEFNMGIRLPGLIGTNAYFLPDPAINLINEEVIILNGLADSTRIGYIIGGIETPDKNIGQTDPSLSFARLQPLEVYYFNGSPTHMNGITNDVLSFRAYQKAVGSDIVVEFELPKAMQVKVSAFTVDGKLLKELMDGSKLQGPQRLSFPSASMSPGVYFIGMEAGSNIKFAKLVIR